MVMNEEEVNKEVYSNLKYKLAPDEQDQAFEATLHSLRKNYFGREEQRGKIVPLRYYLKWATGIAAILIVGLFVWAPWNTSLYEDYAISRTFAVAERGDTGTDVLTRAAEQYNKKNYASARPLFAEAHAAKPDDAMISYYYAITLVETAQEEKGREILAALYEGESVFKYEAAFYTALSYVKQDQKKEAVVWLDKIPPGTSHYDAAIQLKQKLQ
jgi:hypothetical protein